MTTPRKKYYCPPGVDIVTFKWCMKMLLNALVLIVTCAAQSAMGQGTLVIDQQSTSDIATVASSDVFQSFTPSLSAISFVQIQAYNPGQEGQEQFYVNLLWGSSTGPIIGVSSLVSTPVNYVPGGFSTLLFPNPITLTPGDTYYLQPVGQTGYQDLSFIIIGNVPYSGGNLYVDGTENPSYEDLRFTEGIIVPEPSPFAFAGLAGLTFLVAWRIRMHATKLPG